MALGAFVAGLALAESDLAASVLGEVVPLRELFATVFFVFIGLLLQPGVVLAGWPIVLVLLLLITLGKAIPVTGIVAAGGHRLPIGPARRRPARPERRVQLRAGHGRPGAGRAELRDLQPGHGRGGAVDPGRRTAGGRRPRGWATGSGRGRGRPNQIPWRARRPRCAATRSWPATAPWAARWPACWRRAAFRGSPSTPTTRWSAAPASPASPIIYGNAGTPSVLDVAGIDQASTVVFAMDDPLATRQAVQYALRRNQRLHDRGPRPLGAGGGASCGGSACARVITPSASWATSWYATPCGASASVIARSTPSCGARPSRSELASHGLADALDQLVQGVHHQRRRWRAGLLDDAPRPAAQPDRRACRPPSPAATSLSTRSPTYATSPGGVAHQLQRPREEGGVRLGDAHLVRHGDHLGVDAERAQLPGRDWRAGWRRTATR